MKNYPKTMTTSKNTSPTKTDSYQQKNYYEYLSQKSKNLNLEEKIKAQREKITKQKEELLGISEQKMKKPEQTPKHLRKISSLHRLSTKLLTSIKQEKTNDTEDEFGKISTDKFVRQFSEKELLIDYYPRKSKHEKQHKLEQIMKKDLDMAEKTQTLSRRVDNLITRNKSPKNLWEMDKSPYSPKHNLYYISEVVKNYKNKKSLIYDHIEDSFYQFRYFDNLQLMKFYSKQLVKKQLTLEQKTCYKGKKTLVFDLDETLIHCSQMNADKYDEKINLKIDGKVQTLYINIRPYARELLKKLSSKFQIILFTASQKIYADQVIKLIDPEEKIIQHRLYRKDCIHIKDKFYVKDLRILDRKLENTVLIDNAAYSYELQKDNGIPIIPYYRGQRDYELRMLQKYLESLAFQNDVREKNRKSFQLHRYKEFEGINELVENLYLSRN